MRNRANSPNLSIYSAQAMLKDRWGVEMNFDLFLEWAYDAIRRIGYNTDIVKVSAQVDEDGLATLPCDATIIKSVTTDFPIYAEWGAIAIGDDEENTRIISPSGGTARDYSHDISTLHGALVDFEMVDVNTLRVSQNLINSTVYVLAEARILDDEGLPMITEKQSSAVCDWCAFIYTQRNAFSGVKGMDVGYMRQQAEMAIAGARVPVSVSDNEWDQVLDAKTSFGRKSFNRNHSWGK
jgi:hypothetical protein